MMTWKNRKPPSRQKKPPTETSVLTMSWPLCHEIQFSEDSHRMRTHTERPRRLHHIIICLFFHFIFDYLQRMGVSCDQRTKAESTSSLEKYDH